MKKLFFFAAAAFAALSLNAQQIVFTEADSEIAEMNGHVFGADGFTLTCTDEAGKMVVDANNASFGNADEQVKFEWRFKTGGKSQVKEGATSGLLLKVPSAGKLYVYARSGKSSEGRVITISQYGDALLTQELNDANAIDVPTPTEEDPGKTLKVHPVYVVDVVAGDIDIAYAAAVNFYGFSLGAPVVPPTEGFENAAVEVKAAKRIVNGQVVIEKDGRLFNLLGAEMK